MYGLIFYTLAVSNTMFYRENTKIVIVGGVKIGGNSPISVQSMTKTDTSDVEATVNQILELYDAGCDIVRIAVPDDKAAEGLKSIVNQSPLPIVADIHFNYRLALTALESGVAKIRLNPGNLNNENGVSEVTKLAKKLGVPIRIGVNGGSAKRENEASDIESRAKELLKNVECHMRLLTDLDFTEIIVSLKASDAETTILANKLFAEKYDFPLHIGLTEAGIPPAGLIKSTIAISDILRLNIGNTLRVSLTANPIEEVAAGIDILKSLKFRRGGINYISCPTCGRCDVDLLKIANFLKETLSNLDKKLQKDEKEITIAVMGCEVNGPGEAKEADYGVACGNGSGMIFANGNKIKRVKEEEIPAELLAIIKEK